MAMKSVKEVHVRVEVAPGRYLNLCRPFRAWRERRQLNQNTETLNSKLYYTVCIVLYCPVLYCTVLYYTVLYYTIPCLAANSLHENV